MKAKELDAVFGTGFTKVKDVSFGYMLNAPVPPVTDLKADVQERDHNVDVTWDATLGKLSVVAKADGDGLWIPYLGNGAGGDGDKGWGAYSHEVGDKTWVATGKFSGCSIGKFTGPGGTRFAHLITPAAGHPCASVDSQADQIKNATGLHTVVTYRPDTTGEAIAFMLLLNGVWHRRIVRVIGTNVMSVNASSVPFV